MAHLYAGTILKVDLTSGEITREQTSSYADAFLGGRGINIKLFYDHISPGIDPLSPDNVLIFGVGPLGGTSISSGRTEVTAKSPMTNLLGSTNFGGFFASEMKYAGYDHVIITGKAENPVFIWIDNDKVEIRDASQVWGLDTYEAPDVIRADIGNPEAKIAGIGQAGENLVRFASIQHEQGHGGGRTGLGAVMGSKNLKAVAVRGTKRLMLADALQFMANANELLEIIRNDVASNRLAQEGITRADDVYVDEFPGRSISFGTQAELVDRDAPSISVSVPEDGLELKVPRVHAILKKFKPKRAGCYGCPVQCMDHYDAGEGKTGVISCEVYTSLVTQVRCFDIDASLENSILCQRYGIDAISTASIISWLMELYEIGIITEDDTDGVALRWGSPEAIRSMIEKITHREGVGDILAEGILHAAEVFGRGTVGYANQSKGLPMVEIQNPGWTPYLKGGALAIAVGPRGDNMRSLPSEYAIGHVEEVVEAALEVSGFERKEPNSYEGKAELVASIEDIVLLNDMLSTCKFIGGWALTVLTPERLAAFFSAGSGIEITVDDLFKYARKIRTMERAYEVCEGITSEQETLPDRFFNNPIKQGPWRGAVLEREKFDEMKAEYYLLRGWDPKTAAPTEETLVEMGLADVASDLRSKGLLPGTVG